MILPKIIFIDFFDTIMHRYVHPFIVEEQWARNIIDKFGLNVDCKELVTIRRELFQKNANNNESENGDAKYNSVMNALFEKLFNETNNITATVFASYAYKLEIALESGCQYVNKNAIRFIKRAKEQGHKVYVVSDFHMGRNAFVKFLQFEDIEVSLFDDIYISSDWGLTKRSGKLYEKILNSLDVNPQSVLMIGDNRKSDYTNARLYGINALFLPKTFHKIALYLKLKTNYNYSEHINKIMYKKLCKNDETPFGEYSLIFYSFIKRLYENATDNIYFLSREGLLLKKLFDNYCIFQHNKKISYYLLCSRRSIASTNIETVFSTKKYKEYSVRDYLFQAGFSDEEILSMTKETKINPSEQIENINIGCFDEIIKRRVRDNQEAFLEYAKGIKNGDSIVDIGWVGSMQCGIENNLKIKMNGFYFGLNNDSENKLHIKKKGLIFYENMGALFYIFRSNMQLYEQLAAAGHGSPVTYRKNGDTVDIPLEWEEAERKTYEETIIKSQKKIIDICECLSAWNAPDQSDYENARLVLHSGLFANPKRISFLRKLDNGFVFNFGKNNIGLNYKVKINYFRLDFMIHPEKISRYFVKLQRHFAKSIPLSVLYLLIARIYYCFTLLSLKLRGQ